MKIVSLPGEKNQEIEIKLRLSSAEAGRSLLERHGFRVRRARTFEANVVFDTPQRTLRAAGRLLRLRQLGAETILTFKGPAGQASKHKVREELETSVADFGVMVEIFARLGFEPVFRYEKFRSEYAADGAGVITVDETPIGDFFELEGPAEWIDGVAAQLGFAEADYITSSYGSLYLQHCRTNGVSPGNMVFGGQQIK